MNKKIIKIFTIMTILTLILGTLSHFTYEWSGNNSIVGIFSAINESTWEHLKLTFYPMLLIGIIGYYFLKDLSNNYIEGLTIGILISILFTVVFFYGYRFILGKNIAFLNILNFILSVILGYIAFYKIITMEDSSTIYSKSLSIIILILLCICFTTFTVFPPNCKIFISPV